ncbi:MAG TPA: hypothetical protein GXZ30_12500 [Propionibacterium sp.]|nr:hypothetical protein [Propionibacterium sp.]
MRSPTTGTPRTITIPGFSRARYALVLALIGTALALFVLWSLNIGHGLYAFIVLGVAVAALTFFGGPERRARAVSITDSDIRIDRFHRIGTVVDRSELSAAAAERRAGPKGRTQTLLVLTPRDPGTFFTDHRELRSVRVGDAAHVPAGTSEASAHELNEMLRTPAGQPYRQISDR